LAPGKQLVSSWAETGFSVRFEMSKKHYKAQPADFPAKHPAGIQAHINRTISWKSGYNKLNQMAVSSFIVWCYDLPCKFFGQPPSTRKHLQNLK